MLITIAGTAAIVTMIAMLTGLAVFAAGALRAGRPATRLGAGYRATVTTIDGEPSPAPAISHAAAPSLVESPNQDRTLARHPLRSRPFR